MVLHRGVNQVSISWIIIFFAKVWFLHCVVELKGHVPKCDVHVVIPTIDESIGSSKEWSSQNNWNMVWPLCSWFNNQDNKVNWEVKILDLYQDVFNYPPRDFYKSISQ